MKFVSRIALIGAALTVSDGLVATADSRAQCDDCPKPTVFVIVDHSAYGEVARWQPLDERAFKDRLENLVLTRFGEECIELRGQAKVNQLLTEAAQHALAGPYADGVPKDGPVDWDPEEYDAEAEMMATEAMALQNTDYLLIVRTHFLQVSDERVHLTTRGTFWKREGSKLYASRGFNHSRLLSERPDQLTMLEEAIDDLAAEFGSLYQTIQRKEIPVAATVEFYPETIEVGGREVGTLHVRQLVNAEGTPITEWLGNEAVVAIRPKDTRCRWSFDHARTIDGRWYVVRANGGEFQGKLAAPEQCEDTEEHPLEAEVEIAPACWRGEPKANGAAFAQGTARARCQLRVTVAADQDVIEPEESTSGVVYVEDHRGQPVEGDADVALAIDRLRLGTATPGQGTYRHGAPVLFEYTARDDEGTDEIVADVTAQDEWGSRTGDGSATITISEGIAGTYVLVKANGQPPSTTIYGPDADDNTTTVLSGQIEITAEKMEGMNGFPGMDGRIDFTLPVKEIVGEETFFEDAGCLGFYRQVGSTVEIYCHSGDDRGEWLDTGSFWSSHVDVVATLRGEEITWTEEEPYDVVYVFRRIR